VSRRNDAATLNRQTDEGRQASEGPPSSPEGGGEKAVLMECRGVKEMRRRKRMRAVSRAQNKMKIQQLNE
jgi:hypothetical protein